MKSLRRSIGIAGGLLWLAGAQTASAQVIDTIEFTTTFPFTVGYATVPAGRYTITPDDDNGQMFRLTGERSAVFFQADAEQARTAAPKTEVVFKRYGDSYVLKDIWIEGSADGVETKAVEAEHHAAKHAAKGEQRVAGRKTKTTRSRMNGDEPLRVAPEILAPALP